MKRRDIQLSDTTTDVYIACSKTFYPNVKILSKALVTLLVSTARIDRTFSLLKSLKTYLRSIILKTRLNSLTIMYIHRDIDVNVETLIDKFTKFNHCFIVRFYSGVLFLEKLFC